MNVHRNLSLLLLLSAGMLAACSQPATRTTPTNSVEAIVEQRAKARWELLIKRDYMAAYEYFTPGFRAVTPVDVYSVDLRSSPVRWTAAELQSVNCPEVELCEAVIMVDSAVTNMLEGVDRVDFQSQVTEEWILLDGQWYYTR